MRNREENHIREVLQAVVREEDQEADTESTESMIRSIRRELRIVKGRNKRG